MGWGSYVRLLLRDRATASLGWGKGVIAIAADCVTVELRIWAGGWGGGVGQLRSPLTACPCDCARGWGWGGAVTFASCCVTVRLRPWGGGGWAGWGSYVPLLLRDRATARWGW